MEKNKSIFLKQITKKLNLKANNITNQISKQTNMGNQTRIYKKETLEHSWNDGSTMWIVHGDGIRVFTRSQCGDFETLFNSVKPFIEDRKYEVYAN